ncbi:YkgJ family cysteine cluster protein [Pseudohalioglobus sediminis]|uniref:YkgJ family cysteine cluster protein n=1 Tax=Pseudohalioglobus sediminis TaxID=2606449 RepID=A0A5B0WUY6_9GAMM|nr:YkgJ family cysteine cluster protein [Pseudohalioglobus sediminis]KAA1190011.1 YkgJ family cysteine cluster protein [Pseudohalioglobus sediminis]
MQCRTGCGACCIAPSIAQPFHGMPAGKPAGVACVHLTTEMSCLLFGDPRRPRLCDAFQAEPAVCGESREQALVMIGELERRSAPDGMMHP